MTDTPDDLAEKVEAVAQSYRDHDAATASMNAARPTLDATPTERAVYSERYRRWTDTEQALHRTAVSFAKWCAENEVSTRLRGDAGREDVMRDAVIAAYIQGAHDVHDNYQDDRDPDFSEAAHDYFASLTSPVPSSIGDAERKLKQIGEMALFHFSKIRSGTPLHYDMQRILDIALPEFRATAPIAQADAGSEAEDLGRLLNAADSGRSGVDLSKLSREEIRKLLFKHCPDAGSEIDAVAVLKITGLTGHQAVHLLSALGQHTLAAMFIGVEDGKTTKGE